ncbi:MAG: ATP:cob(I)alamin adenosyltransferase, partial [Candidatus Terrybacteria bacterium]|nr:ATP:cob(I)alamin adenosyltransferase [Candidatus Terrybacteria bacterium]
MPKSYTRTGDDGTTGRFGGARLKKSSPLIAVLGALDEANAAIGLARALSQHEPNGELGERLEKLQHLLFRVGADLSTPLDYADPRAPRLTASDTKEIEEATDTLDA